MVIPAIEGFDGGLESGREIFVHSSRILSHVLHDEPTQSFKKIQVISTDSGEPPIINSDFYLANIGTSAQPLLLELRFTPIDVLVENINPSVAVDGDDHRARIALLMTNERYQTDLEKMAGGELYERVRTRGLEYDVIIAPESLGPKLSQEMARASSIRDGKKIFITSLQKGKLHGNRPEDYRIGSPKPWVDEQSGIELTSGTSHEGVRQMLYLDQAIAEKIKEMGWKVLLVDDARLSGGTLDHSVELLQRLGINVVGMATILNEDKPRDNIVINEQEIPFIWLTKLPLFTTVDGRYQPIPGTYDGLKEFYLETGGLAQGSTEADTALLRVEREFKEKYALLSVSDKTGIAVFARRIASQGYKIISTGGTAKVLKEAGIPYIPVREITGEPEAFGGRMKSISFPVESGILYRRDNPADIDDSLNSNTPRIDLVVCNFYPFEKTIAKDGITRENAREQIDIGGPTMVDAAAKNSQSVLVVTDPSDYDKVATAIENGFIPNNLRDELAIKAFDKTSKYYGAVKEYFEGVI